MKTPTGNRIFSDQLESPGSFQRTSAVAWVARKRGTRGVSVSVAGEGKKKQTLCGHWGETLPTFISIFELQVLQCESWQDMFPFLMVYVGTLYIYIYIFCGGVHYNDIYKQDEFLVGIHKEEIHKHVNNHGQDWSLKLL